MDTGNLARSSTSNRREAVLELLAFFAPWRLGVRLVFDPMWARRLPGFAETNGFPNLTPSLQGAKNARKEGRGARMEMTNTVDRSLRSLPLFAPAGEIRTAGEIPIQATRS